MSFSENLKAELFFNSIKAIDLSRETKISYSTILSYLNKNVLPRVDQAVKIATYLNVSVEYLVTGKETRILFSNKYHAANELKTIPKSVLRPLQELIHEISIQNKI